TLEVSWSAGDTILTVKPATELAPGTTYTVFIGELNFADGTELSDEFSFSFTTAGDVGSQPLALDEIKFWGYQIQSVSAIGADDALAESAYDMLVIEPTRTDWSSVDREFDTANLVETLKASKASDGLHRKLIIAYIDIGEAEDWRWYWTWSKNWPVGESLPGDWPDWIVTRDPDGFEGNYPVAYWEPQWQNIIIDGQGLSSAPYGDYNSTLDETLRSGFDGIYLDWVEGYENDEVAARARAEGLDPAVEMIAFIGRMRDYALARNPDFLIIQQNAVSLIDGHPELLEVIDAVSQEPIWFDGDATDVWDDPNGFGFRRDADTVNFFLGFLDQFQEANVPVFDCEYALEDAEEAYQLSLGRGYVPYVTRRSLGQLTTTPPPGL
ncbi:MAG: endo alpha-1,4 polygalactosaminidase, partial [Phycisphaerae bacterium]